MKKRYLVPLDGSELAEHALPWAELLAGKYDSQVELLQCYEPIASVYLLPDFAPAPVYDDQSGVSEKLEKYLKTRAEALPAGMAVTKTCEGDAASAILDRAESGDIEAVVMASHGRGGLGRWLLGSIATKVVRGSRHPVLVVNAQAKVPPTPRIDRILVPLDGSETAEVALSWGASLAKDFGAELKLYRGIAHTPIGHPTLDKAVALEVANAREYLDKIKSRYSDTKITTVAEVAGPKLGILEHANDCDLIVMSSHGLSGVKRWLLGSVAESVLQSADKPLMIVYERHED
jgi:nucleotide-binding universal stress UspA family protein